MKPEKSDIIDETKEKVIDIFISFIMFWKTLYILTFSFEPLEKETAKRILTPGRYLLVATVIQILVTKLTFTKGPIATYELPNYISVILELVGEISLSAPIFSILLILTYTIFPFILASAFRQGIKFKPVFFVVTYGIITTTFYIFCISITVYYLAVNNYQTDFNEYISIALILLLSIAGLYPYLWISISFKKTFGISLAKALLFAGVGSLFTAVYLNWVSAAYVIDVIGVKEGQSYMSPTLKKGEVILINKSIYSFRQPKRFELVHYIGEDPDSFTDRRIPLLGRVMALPNELLEVKQGQVFVNEKLLEDKYRYLREKHLPPSAKIKGFEQTFTPRPGVDGSAYTETNPPFTDLEPIKLGKNQYFIRSEQILFPTQDIIDDKDIFGKMYYRIFPSESKGEL